MKNLILIASLLMAGGLWAEEDIQGCRAQSEKDIADCKKGDLLVMKDQYYRIIFLVTKFCEPETVVAFGDQSAMCIYTGKTRKIRNR